MKKCFSCKETRDYTQFFRHHQTQDGYHSWCKSCCTEGNKRSRAKTNSTIEGRAKIFLQNAQKSARKRHQPFALTIADIVECWRSQKEICAYSGRSMTLEAGELNTVSIERIDSKQGYIPSNTILVCQAINRMKSDFGFDDFFELCKDVAIFLSDDDINICVGAYK